MLKVQLSFLLSYKLSASPLNEYQFRLFDLLAHSHTHTIHVQSVLNQLAKLPHKLALMKVVWNMCLLVNQDKRKIIIHITGRSRKFHWFWSSNLVTMFTKSRPVKKCKSWFWFRHWSDKNVLWKFQCLSPTHLLKISIFNAHISEDWL